MASTGPTQYAHPSSRLSQNASRPGSSGLNHTAYRDDRRPLSAFHRTPQSLRENPTRPPTTGIGPFPMFRGGQYVSGRPVAQPPYQPPNIGNAAPAMLQAGGFPPFQHHSAPQPTYQQPATRNGTSPIPQNGQSFQRHAFALPPYREPAMGNGASSVPQNGQFFQRHAFALPPYQEPAMGNSASSVPQNGQFFQRHAFALPPYREPAMGNGASSVPQNGQFFQRHAFALPPYREPTMGNGASSVPQNGQFFQRHAFALPPYREPAMGNGASSISQNGQSHQHLPVTQPLSQQSEMGNSRPLAPPGDQPNGYHPGPAPIAQIQRPSTQKDDNEYDSLFDELFEGSDGHDSNLASTLPNDDTGDGQSPVAEEVVAEGTQTPSTGDDASPTLDKPHTEQEPLPAATAEKIRPTVEVQPDHSASSPDQDSRTANPYPDQSNSAVRPVAGSKRRKNGAHTEEEQADATAAPQRKKRRRGNPRQKTAESTPPHQSNRVEIDLTKDPLPADELAKRRAKSRETDRIRQYVEEVKGEVPRKPGKTLLEKEIGAGPASKYAWVRAHEYVNENRRHGRTIHPGSQPAASRPPAPQAPVPRFPDIRAAKYNLSHPANVQLLSLDEADHTPNAAGNYACFHVCKKKNKCSHACCKPTGGMKGGWPAKLKEIKKRRAEIQNRRLQVLSEHPELAQSDEDKELLASHRGRSKTMEAEDDGNPGVETEVASGGGSQETEEIAMIVQDGLEKLLEEESQEQSGLSEDTQEQSGLSEDTHEQSGLSENTQQGPEDEASDCSDENQDENQDEDQARRWRMRYTIEIEIPD